MENRKDTTHGGLTTVQVIQGEAELLNETSTDTQARTKETLAVKSFVVEKRKTVVYLGYTLQVDKKVTHIAADKDGAVYGYAGTPKQMAEQFVAGSIRWFSGKLATVEFYEEDDWKHSVRKV